MQTHEDSSHAKPMDPLNHAEFLKTLQRRAEDAAAAGEEPLAEWDNGDMRVRHMPNDEQDILRISVGGSPALGVNYCAIRGDRKECISLLNKALNALLRGPRA